jgi:hypothetical protein
MTKTTSSPQHRIMKQSWDESIGSSPHHCSDIHKSCIVKRLDQNTLLAIQGKMTHTPRHTSTTSPRIPSDCLATRKIRRPKQTKVVSYIARFNYPPACMSTTAVQAKEEEEYIS